MKLNASPFEMIKSGVKSIELRLYDEKRQKIKIGDTIIFTNTLTGEKIRNNDKKTRYKNTRPLYPYGL